MEPKKSDSALSKSEATALTKRICKAVDGLWSLLLEAHERKAWKVLGYETWEAYVKTEFGMGRSRSYQLLDQGRVIEAVRDATGDLSTTVDISERDARDIKDDLPAVTEEIKAKVGTGEVPEKAASETVAAKRAEKEKAREAKKAQQAEFDRQREEHTAKLPAFVAEREQAKAEAIAARNNNGSPPDPLHDGLSPEDRISELEEAVRVLEDEVETLRAENKLYGEMKVQFEQGGFDRVVAGKDAEIHALETRLYRESQEKISNLRRGDYFLKILTEKYGWSRNVAIDIETGEVLDG